MSKQRNRETKIWDDPWFRKLSCPHKLLWEYICDKADDAGVWKEDMDLASFQINAELDKTASLAAFNAGKNRIIEFKPGYWFINGFIGFHYGVLKDTNNFHSKVLSLIQSHGIEGLISPCQGAKDKGKGKEEARTSEKKPEKEIPARNAFEVFWDAYPKKRSKGQAEKAWKNLKLDEQLQDRIMRALERAKTTAQWKKNGGEFIPYPATWLNAIGWEDDHGVVLPVNQPKKHDPNCSSCKGTGYWEDPDGKRPRIKCPQ